MKASATKLNTNVSTPSSFPWILSVFLSIIPTPYFGACYSVFNKCNGMLEKQNRTLSAAQRQSSSMHEAVEVYSQQWEKKIYLTLCLLLFWNKMPNRQFKEGGGDFVLQFWGTTHHGREGNGWWQKHEAAGHFVCVVRKQREMTVELICFFFFYVLFRWGSQSVGLCCL